jgi:cell shape-determining protein MreD
MRRIDAILIALVVFLAGGLIYLILQLSGLEAQNAGIWSQALLVFALIGWVLTYLFRVFTNNMTYHKQVKDYEDAFFKKQLEKLSPEEIEKLMQDN